ncbi:uncharacterized protein L969DRAFT_45689 [Mixia osmundae IAM 14324]|uniref:Uncharacterized protein n=1 Tax=Mixia osmundae (strain CBS 9802 / IAM 14324 / JCM 22182 / KY 12970) TaxID=764103 RepID=G7DXR7_MIXOS|nr:uncharacterized protein L969DRAFT_45689 [Mixia osmundae IAM 14324]KEI41136.1 hypothetical protein L969DRAFT_45689 [Mixia osmundae IAM 14324]GAA95377.1 hypothetical protein E5Q_02031 [Mixia osmundae IAM 14324]
MSRERSMAAQADAQYLMRHAAIKVVQGTVIAVPPLLLATQLYRRTFSLNRFLRGNAIASLVGAAGGAGLYYGRARNFDDVALADRVQRLRSNRSQAQVDDWTLIGSIIGSLLTTTLFMRRANVLYCLLGGASLGAGGGVLTHMYQTYGLQGSIEAVQEGPPGGKIIDDLQSGKADEVLKGKPT